MNPKSQAGGQAGQAGLLPRLITLSTLVIIVFGIIMLRLYYLQIIRGELYRTKSESNRIQPVMHNAPRGLIYDRNGELIVSHRPSFTLGLLPFRDGISEKEQDDLKERLASILGMDEKRLSEIFAERMKNPFDVIQVKYDLSDTELAHIMERKEQFRRVVIEVDTRRQYLKKDKGSVILGYVSEINKPELSKLKKINPSYRSGNLIGKNGIEKTYEQYLKGVDGITQVEITASGYQLRAIREMPAVQGNSLHLTVDWKIQEFMEKAMEGKKGSAILMDCRSGEIIGMVSNPSYDPNVFTDLNNPSRIKGILTDKEKPLFNKVIQSLYPPGSTFKIVLSVAALEENLVDTSLEYFCGGSYYAGKTFECWKKEGHKWFNIESAIISSCNVFFYQLGIKKLGVDLIAKFSRLMGLGAKTGIDLPGEAGGIVPSTAWKKKVYKDKWYTGETANFSIGQGYLLVTPLQMALVYSTFINGGKVFVPYIVKEVRDINGKVIFKNKPKVVRDNHFSEKTYKTVKNALKGVVERGTAAYSGKIKDFYFGGKTGTAQNPHGDDHAWFLCYFDYSSPRYVMAVFVENGGHGSTAAAPVAREVIMKMRENGML